MLDGQPFYFIGTNYWYGGVLPLKKDIKKGIGRLRSELDFLKSNGVTNVRVVAGAEGEGTINGVNRVGPPLQIESGVFDSGYLKGLDVLLAELNKRKMTAVIYLGNNWNWTGGFLQYLRWHGHVPDSIFLKEISWDQTKEYVSKFYTCGECMDDYFKQVKYVINRTNSITGLPYKKDPAILSWEIANEPRPMVKAANSAYAKFIKNTASFIKNLDPYHLLTTGTEGYMSTDDMQLYKDIHDDKNIDYLTIHIWPKNWSWIKGTAVAESIETVLSNTRKYISDHVQIARELNKPLVIEEFGLPRNSHSYDVDSPTLYRDIFYKEILSQWLDNKKNTGLLAGTNFWAFGGSARPVKGQVMWKEGDEYMGDPPMEEQGLNTVFDSDKTTWKMVGSFSRIANKMVAIEGMPIDKMATQRTVNLYHNLKKLQQRAIMFGHQDDLAYGVGWKYVPGKSDVKELTGDYPAVYGFELGNLELDHPVNLDSVPFDKMKVFISEAYSRGGVITLSWHLNNPLTGKTAWDPAKGTVQSILPGGSKHELYASWLDKVSVFIKSLKDKKGEAIPIIFRPFHELNGNWFWWGKDHCTPEEFKQLWHFTVEYLRDTKNIHQLLYAYNTDRFGSEEDYLLKYPGNEWADLIGFDIYQRKQGEEGNREFINDLSTMLSMLEKMAGENNKIAALTEFGYAQVPDANWWTDVFYKALGNHNISYVLAWRSAGLKPSGEKEFYIPYKGQVSEKDFIKFYNKPNIIFQKEVTKENLYKKK